MTRTAGCSGCRSVARDDGAPFPVLGHVDGRTDVGPEAGMQPGKQVLHDVEADGVVLHKEIQDTLAERQLELLAGDFLAQPCLMEASAGIEHAPGHEEMHVWGRFFPQLGHMLRVLHE